MRNELKKALKKALSHESKRVIVDSSKLESWLDKLDNTYVQSVCYLCGTEQQVSIATLVSHTHAKCVKCGKTLFLIKSRSNGHIEGPRVADEHSTDMCAACDTDLATCDTIWAAEGLLYCSRECGIHNFKTQYGDDAERHFDEVAEEINPRDIGIK
jgi:hypothetical protein